MITPEIKKELNQAKNVKAFLAILDKYFALEKAELGVISRPILINNIEKVLKGLNVKPK